jgi:hypothetical protein
MQHLSFCIATSAIVCPPPSPALWVKVKVSSSAMRKIGVPAVEILNFHQFAASGRVKWQFHGITCGNQRRLGDFPEIFVRVRQRPKPYVLQLSRAPSLAELRSLSGEYPVRRDRDGVNVEQGSIRIEHKAFGGFQEFLDSSKEANWKAGWIRSRGRDRKHPLVGKRRPSGVVRSRLLCLL